MDYKRLKEYLENLSFEYEQDTQKVSSDWQKGFYAGKSDAFKVAAKWLGEEIVKSEQNGGNSK